MSEELENKVDFSFFFECLSDSNNIITFEHFKHFDLSLYSFFSGLILVSLFELFDGDYFMINNLCYLVIVFIY